MLLFGLLSSTSSHPVKKNGNNDRLNPEFNLLVPFTQRRVIDPELTLYNLNIAIRKQVNVSSYCCSPLHENKVVFSTGNHHK